MLQYLGALNPLRAGRRHRRRRHRPRRCMRRLRSGSRSGDGGEARRGLLPRQTGRTRTTSRHKALCARTSDPARESRLSCAALGSGRRASRTPPSARRRISGARPSALVSVEAGLSVHAAPPRHRHVHDRPGKQEHGNNDQAAVHVVALARPGRGLPHSLHASDCPIGYAHAGQRPRFTRMNRRSTNGPGISSQRTVA